MLIRGIPQYIYRTNNRLKENNFGHWKVELMAHSQCTERDRDRDQETMGLYITLCTVHTTQGHGQEHGTIVSYCAHPSPCAGPGSVQCVWAINEEENTNKNV